jgi:hypothetical protein
LIPGPVSVSIPRFQSGGTRPTTLVDTRVFVVEVVCEMGLKYHRMRQTHRERERERRFGERLVGIVA